MFVLVTVYYVYLLLQLDMTSLMYASWRGHLSSKAELRRRSDAKVNIQDKKVSSTKAVR